MSTKQSSDPQPSTQVLVRLPAELARRFAELVPARGRSRFLVDLLRRELERESLELSQAARRLSDLESKTPELMEESDSWVESRLVSDQGDFEAAEFERQFRQAQAEALQ